MPAAPPALILASTSRYRRELLGRLGLDFEVEAPGVDEAALPGEAPAALAARLALAKAAAVAARHPGAVVIGSDQVAECAGRALGKPGTPAQAVRQLTDASGQVVIFHTAVAVARPGAAPETHTDRTRVRFRTLPRAEIERYVERDAPLDCAGSFRSEGLGVALFEAIETVDPTALVGLPLIWLAGALGRAGLSVL
ncbi:MAG: septum formation protein Maf [Proteobacteria bacterium]|nr:septum formation protein Maf [Pseudomonadota bacterium]